jgi:hypothetical protein
MYIPSILKSVQQVACVEGNNTIAATDPNYTELSVTVASCNASGFASPLWGIEQNSPTNLWLHTIAPAVGSQPPLAPRNAHVTVREYLSLHFRRPFIHGNVEIATQQLSGSSNLGVAFSSKAYVVSRGWTYNLGRVALEITDAQIWSDLILNHAGGIVNANRRQRDYTDAPGSVYHWFTVVDPW